MRTLYLLRHAKARREPEVTDRERRLHRRGERQGEALAAYFAKRGRTVDRILCSPSRRTRETLALVLPALGGKPDVRFPEELYLASAETLLKRVQRTEPAVRSLMLIGHNDGLHQFALALIATDALPLLARFPTGALAQLDFEIGAWDEIGLGTGHLAASVDPDEIRGVA